jgi:DNA gyrase inhibitor GyrI
MSKSSLALYGAFTGLLLLGGALLPVSSQESMPLSATEVREIRTAAAKPGPVSYLIVKQDFTGDFETIHVNLDKFMKEFQDQKLDTSLGKATPTALLIFKDNPDEKKQFDYAIGLTVPGKLKVKAPLSVESLRFPAAVKVTHIGQRYQQLGLVYKNIHSSRAEKAPKEPARFPVVVELLNDPARVPYDQVKTRMVVPVGPISNNVLPE